MEKHLNICILNDSFPPVIDGVANAALNYARILSGMPGSVSVITPWYPGVNDDYPFPVIRYPSVKTAAAAGYRVGLPVPVKYIREIARAKPDIIHCHCPFASAVMARLLKAATGAPVIFTYHTKFDIDIDNTLESELMRSCAKRLVVSNIGACDEVWAVSRGAHENLNSLGYSGGCRVMENGVDFPKGRVNEKNAAKLFRKLGLDDDVPVFLFVGRMMWYKGIRTIIDSLAIAKAAGVRLKMIFVGDGEDFAQIKNYAFNHGLIGECIFTGRVSERDVLRTYFCLADLFLFPSEFDTNGIVVKEAAACGLASVLIRGSAAAEAVTHRQNGILFDGEPAELAHLIKELSSNRGYMRKLGLRAMEELYLSWDDAVFTAYRRYLELLR